MNREDLAKVRRIFYTAVKLPSSERADFVRQSSADNLALQKEVEKLLESYETSSADENRFDEIAEEFGIGKLHKGQKFSHYEIDRQIGAGGMGEVYLARDLKLGRRAAIKILQTDLTENSGRMRRFVQEAKAVSALNHPNILTIYEIGEEDATVYIATEFIDGETLGDLLKKRRPTLDETLDISVQIVTALCAAHENRIIHRDIKPENIMIRRDGLVKVLDFGLAKLYEDDAATRDRSEEETILNTNPGVILGTVSYMSPEQMRGGRADARSDIWSFGVIFYEMLAGKRPFGGENAGDIIAETLKSEVSFPHDPNLRNSRDFADIVEKTLAKNCADRYETSEDLLNDLRKLKKKIEIESELEKTGQMTPVGFAAAAPRRSKKFRSLMILPFVFALAAAMWFWRGALFLQKNEFERIEIKSLTTSGNIVESTISPDGKLIAYAKRGRDGQSLWVRQKSLGTSEIKLIEPSADNIFNGMTFTPDGSEIYFLLRPKNNSINRLSAVPILGGQPPKTILDDVDSPPQFAPDGKRFAFMRRNVQTGITALMIADKDGANVKVLVERKSPLGFMMRPLDWSADGKKIFCIANGISENTTIAKRNIVSIDAETGAERSLSEPLWREFESLAQTKNGLIFTATELQTPLQFQLWYLPFTGAPRRLTSEVSFYNNVSVAKNSGEVIARQIQVESHVWLVDAVNKSTAPRRVSPNNSDGSNGLTWTADGNLIYTSNLNGLNSLQKISPNGGAPVTLTTGDYALNQPCATADGKYFVYNSTLSDSMNLWRIDADGGNLKRLIKDNGEFTDCAPDGKTVYFNAIRDGGQSSIWRIPIDGGDPQRVTSRITLRPQLSPDGKTLACYYRADAKAAWQIGILSLEEDRLLQTMDLPKTVQLNTPLAWTKDGKNLVLVETRDGIANLWQHPLTGEAPTPITNFADETLPTIANFKFSSDGKQIAVVRARRIADIVQIAEER